MAILLIGWVGRYVFRQTIRQYSAGWAVWVGGHVGRLVGKQLGRYVVKYARMYVGG